MFFRCDHTGHFGRDFLRGALIYFHYNQMGGKKDDCLRLTGGAVATLAPSTLRIIVGRQVKA